MLGSVMRVGHAARRRAITSAAAVSMCRIGLRMKIAAAIAPREDIG